MAGVGVGVLLAAAYGFQTAGLELTTVSSTGFITGLYVVFTPFIALALFGTAVPRAVWIGVALRRRRAPAPERRAGRVGARKRARARRARSSQPFQIAAMERFAPRYDPRALTFLQMATCVRRLRRHRGGARPDRGSARLDGVGRAPRDRRLRGRARLPHRDVGAGAHDGSACRAPVHARGPVRRAVRRPSRRRGARLAGLARLRGDDGRDPPRRAGCGRALRRFLARSA